MRNSNSVLSARRLPEIVFIVLRQAYRQVCRGGLSPEVFARQITRLRREELLPRGLDLEWSDAAGSVSFTICDGDHRPVAVLHCPGACEEDSAYPEPELALSSVA